MKTNLWIDTDMGNDDIMAISMLFLSNKTSIKGISLVNGVSSVNRGYENINVLLTYCGVNIPILSGYTTALVPNNTTFPIQDRKRAENLTLLSNLGIPKNKLKNDKQIGVKSIASFISKNITILALGPLTNLASIIQNQGAKFKNNVNQIILMGGGLKKGNVPPSRKAEYNIWLDPQAAQIVFNSGIPIIMVGIDATSCVPNSKEFVSLISEIQPNTIFGKIIKAITLGNTTDFDYFYDPLAASLLFNSTIQTDSKQGQINVSLKGDDIGTTYLNACSNGNVKVVTNVNSERFFSLLIDLMTL
ncbi:hypothetical protein COY16_01595 [Candidatus Roizmanbacteria bacterium CG_4_10_14_0_2_um_filter_39_13]|uniref:Inosine/uridine-preferring nucleoside hydrolase domain-containing protein n=1 Tax=Candidatus Roizmanbacteria bacterium CG_4_10_14_0_2_um_filter_39_13 TaxID=1974825 RepID=A0A2M7U0B8_9BACT|nr:MAG: hypothetical protein COY16_01595 [Candidatus Roizmanbacteria bacterium CG_4_10_14_0_2_um_filter_39_13]